FLTSRSLLLGLTLRGQAAESLFLGALAVEFEEPGEDFVAEVVGPAVAPGLLAATAASGLFVVFILLVVEQEFAGGLQLGPAVGVEDGAVHRGVQLAEF